jgi:hypothetical protein
LLAISDVNCLLGDVFPNFAHAEVHGTKMGAVWWVGNTFPIPGVQQDSGGLNTTNYHFHAASVHSGKQARPPTLNCFLKVLYCHLISNCTVTSQSVKSTGMILSVS